MCKHKSLTLFIAFPTIRVRVIRVMAFNLSLQAIGKFKVWTSNEQHSIDDQPVSIRQ